MGAAEMGSASKESDTSADASGGTGDSAQGTCCSGNAEWSVLQPQDILHLRVGQLLRIRVGRTAPQYAQIAGILHASSVQVPSKFLHRVRFMRSGSLPSKFSYYNFSQPGLLAFFVQGSDCNIPAERCPKENPQNSAWPDCVRQGESIRGLENSGVFVNLLGFGVNSGCFRDDCSHSDHFDSSSPASCAQICASIGACKWWSFWVAPSGGVCWLRGHDRHRLPMINSVAGASDCVPAAGQPLPSVDWLNPNGVAEARSKRHAEPTLFELAQGQ